MKIKPYFSNLLYILFILISLSGCNNNSKNPTIQNADIVAGSENTILIPLQNEDGKWGYVDENKNWIIDPQFYDARMFNKGAATAFKSKDECGIINTKGEWVIQPKYEVVGPIGNGYFFAAYKDKRMAIIDEYENIAVDGLMEESLTKRFTENLVPVSKWITFDNEKVLVGFKNYKNEWTIKPQYISYTLFKDGYAVVRKSDSTQIVIDTLGNTVLSIPQSIDMATQYADSLIPVRSNNKWGYMNIKGNIKIDFQFDNAYSFESGIAIIQQENINKIINTEGEVILSLPEYNKIDITLDGYIVIFTKEEQSHKGIMDRNGNILIPPTYSNIVYQGNNFFRATEDLGKVWYIDSKGNKF